MADDRSEGGGISRFALHRKYDVFTVGPSEFHAGSKRSLGTLPFVAVRPSGSIPTTAVEHSFVLLSLDWRDLTRVANLAKEMRTIQTPLIYVLVYCPAESPPTPEHLLLSVELGVKFVFFGPDRDMALRRYIKRIVVDDQDAVSLAGFEGEFSRCDRLKDIRGLAGLHDRLAKEAREREEALVLLARINRSLDRPKRTENFLRRILFLNPQNLWAANELGRHYLRQGRASEGIELLERLSHFHDLNAERALDLGDAYLNVGHAPGARVQFEKGKSLSGGQDPRFDIGLTKVDILEGHPLDPGRILQRQDLSFEVLAYLNMRAIMAIKSSSFDRGFAMYEQAIAGAGHDRVVSAKLYFNLALGHARAGLWELAAKYFVKSLELGGEDFARARQPLAFVRRQLKAVVSGGDQYLSAQDSVDLEMEYEQFVK